MDAIPDNTGDIRVIMDQRPAVVGYIDEDAGKYGLVVRLYYTQTLRATMLTKHDICEGFNKGLPLLGGRGTERVMGIFC